MIVLIRAFCKLPVYAFLMLTGMVQAAEPVRAPTVTVFTQQPTSAKTSKKPDIRPLWNELTPVQQQSLAPLSGEWNKLPARNKEKWLAIGNKFAAMPPAEQERMQNRMRDWAKLTPAQRRSVRENYTRAKKLDADKKSAQWSQYLQLSEEQKKKLAQAKLPKHVSALPTVRHKPAPTIQLPEQALEQPLSTPTPVLPAAVTPAETK